MVDKNPALIAKECISNAGGSYPILSLACYDKEGECLRVLIEAGADVDIKATKTGWTALHQAAYINNERAVSILLKYGANQYVYDHGGLLPTKVGCYWQNDQEQLRRNKEIVTLIKDFRQDETVITHFNP